LLVFFPGLDPRQNARKARAGTYILCKYLQRMDYLRGFELCVARGPYLPKKRLHGRAKPHDLRFCAIGSSPKELVTDGELSRHFGKRVTSPSQTARTGCEISDFPEVFCGVLET
jgi:hypothetical protein